MIGARGGPSADVVADQYVRQGPLLTLWASCAAAVMETYKIDPLKLTCMRTMHSNRKEWVLLKRDRSWETNGSGRGLTPESLYHCHSRSEGALHGLVLPSALPCAALRCPALLGSQQGHQSCRVKVLTLSEEVVGRDEKTMIGT